MVAHCAGMVDLVALPVWVGTLISGYGLDPQRAGGLATLFLAGAVTSSLAIAPRLQRLRGRTVVPIGYGLAALAFAGVVLTSDYALMALLHLLAGMSAATALSVTHGTIGRSRSPHRLFAIVGLALGVFGILFMGAAPKIVAAVGAPLLFVIFTAIMAFAACVSAIAFPLAGSDDVSRHAATGKLPRMVWLGAAGISCMALVQAMVFSFVERIGADHGYGVNAVTGVLIALGFVNLLPAPLAAFLEKRLAPRTVMMCGPVAQAILALVLTQSQAFASYAIATMFFAAVLIFTHTFAFGLLAELDPSGRAVAATPAMLMIGAAIGPILGGSVVKSAGYASLGLAAALVAACAVACFLPRRPGAAATQS
jgi:predicted MFS family arabinose efflux permease